MRKTALAAGGFALVIALTACGGEDGGGSGGADSNGLFGNTQQLFDAASKKTNDTKSAKYTMTMNMMGQQVKANGEASFAGADSKVAMTMDMMGQQMEMRFIDKVMYMKMPAAAQSQMGGKEWVKISADGKDPISKQMGGSFDQMAKQSDPTKTLQYMKEAGKITKSEETTLDGQPATHYSIDLDFAKLADQMGSSSGVTPEQAKQLADKVGTVPMELWLDSDELPAKISMDMSKVMEASGAPGGQGGGKIEMKYTDWGTPVNVEAPPADKVGEMPSGAMGG